MKASLLLLLISGFLGTIRAQSDSLITAFNSTRPASERLELAFEIAKANLGRRQDTALKYLHLALKDSSKSTDKKPVGLCLNALGVYHYYEGNYVQTAYFSGQAVEILSTYGDAVSLMKARKNHALGLEWQGKYASALKEYHQLLQEQQQYQDSGFIAGTLNDIGNILLRTKNYTQAFSYLFKGMRMTEGDDGRLLVRANLLNSLGTAYLDLGQKDSAFICLEQAYQIHHRLGISAASMNVLTNLCNCFDPVSQNKKYQDCHEEMLELQLEFQNLEGAFRSYINLAVGYAERNDCRNAIVMLDSAAVYRGEIQDLYDLRGYFRNRSEQLFACGDIQNAYLNRLVFERYRDSVFDVEKEQVLQDLEGKFQNEKKQKDIDLLTAKDANQQLVIQNQRWILVAGGLFLVIAALGGFVFVVRQRSRNELAKQDALHRMREEERVRIARDMHDEIGSGLTRISLLVQKAKWRQCKGKLGVADEDLEQIFAESQELPKSLKDIIWALNPANDTLAELVSKIRNHASEFMDATSVALELDFPEAFDDLVMQPVVRKNVFLIVKEALNNAVKHADAKHVKLSLWLEGSSFGLTVADDGKGFDTWVDPSGNGIFNMRKRAEWAGAELKVESSKGKGTKISLLHVPTGNTTKV